ncbi:MAG TPA: phosphoglucosamine mutase [Candidatus Bilamarchaeum sp.]|nr:phosphoglucosamine mutase [Candidatus Bilamarchaeum sp.]
MVHFGTNGARGLFGELGPAEALALAQKTGTYFKGGKVIAARDCRLTGEILKNSVIAGLASVGCQVVDLDVASSPTAEWMIRKEKAAGCVIVSASHNPPEWNALKVVDGNGAAISKERGAEIEKQKPELARWDRAGKITKNDMAAAEHIRAIAGLVNGGAIRQKKPKIVIDCGNGAGAMVAPGLFKNLGCQILSLNAHMDGRFPGRPSEPAEANVKELIALVKSSGADAGVAWDGDGDRVIFVDEKGNYVIGDKVFALSIMWKALGRGGKLGGDMVTTVATSRCAEDVAKKFGSKVRFTAIGAPYLCEEMLKKPAAMGGEEVGGVIWPELSLAKDGFLTAAKMAEALCQRPLSEWLEEVPEYYNVKTKIEADEKGKKEIVGRVLAHAKKEKLAHVTVDGVRMDFNSGWVIVRASGTENYVRVFAEAKTPEEARKLADEYKKIATG